MIGRALQPWEVRAREREYQAAARQAEEELDDFVRKLLDDVVAGLERRLAAEARMDAVVAQEAKAR